MYKVSDNPVMRFPENRELMADTGNWMIARLKSRREKAVAVEMEQSDIGYYLPLFKKKTLRKDNGKTRISINPLFPGYISFVNDEGCYKKLIRSDHVSNILPIKNQNEFIKELMQVDEILNSEIPFRIHGKIFPGTKVRLMSGPLFGVEGVVLKENDNTQFIVSVEMFSQSLSVTIDQEDLAAIK